VRDTSLEDLPEQDSSLAADDPTLGIEVEDAVQGSGIKEKARIVQAAVSITSPIPEREERIARFQTREARVSRRYFYCSPCRRPESPPGLITMPVRLHVPGVPLLS
jgi:hypothetical protein